MKKNAILIGIGLLIMLILVGNAANLYRLTLVDQLSATLYDYRLKFTMPNTLDERIVILDIDEKSLKEEGRWPWSRDRLGLLLDKLFDNDGIAVVGFDVVFAEKDSSSGLGILQNLGKNQLKNDENFQTVLSKIQPQLEYDALFASKIENRKVVLGYFLANQKDKDSAGILPQPTFTADAFKDRQIGFTSWNSFGANLAQLQLAAASAGYFNPMIDADGVVRRVPMLAEYNGAYY